MKALLLISTVLSGLLLLKGTKKSGSPLAPFDPVHASEAGNSNAQNARFQAQNAYLEAVRLHQVERRTSDAANLLLQTADAIQRGLGMPLTAQNLRSLANQFATGQFG